MGLKNHGVVTAVVSILGIVLVIGLVSPRLYGDVQSFEIDPARTQAGIVQFGGPHVAGFDPAVKPKGLLVLSLIGTTRAPRDFVPFDVMAAHYGYQFLSLDYANKITTVICRENPSPTCFDQFHGAIVSGESGSSWVKVDAVNSIENRVLRALQFLVAKDRHRWKVFLKDGAVNWDRIVVIGHSQGSGHAAFLAKRHPVSRAIILAGLQDASSAGVATWVSEIGATASVKYWALLHDKDPFGVEQQLQTLQVLLGPQLAAPLTVSLDVPGGGAHVFISNFSEVDAHNSILGPTYRNIWKCLLLCNDK